MHLLHRARTYEGTVARCNGDVVSYWITEQISNLVTTRAVKIS
jgi:hypothetical protein